jgi:hypothetical protein
MSEIRVCDYRSFIKLKAWARARAHTPIHTQNFMLNFMARNRPVCFPW